METAHTLNKANGFHTPINEQCWAKSGEHIIEEAAKELVRNNENEQCGPCNSRFQVRHCNDLQKRVALHFSSLQRKQCVVRGSNRQIRTVPYIVRKLYSRKILRLRGQIR